MCYFLYPVLTKAKNYAILDYEMNSDFNVLHDQLPDEAG